MLQMLGVFAEFEHATIVDRITAGIERRAKEGRWYSGRPPFGYTLKDGQLAPDPITAPVVRRIFRLYVGDRLGTIAIAHQLRAEHAPSTAAGWGHPAVHRVLTNPTYLGRIRWRDQDFQSTHEPLIDQSSFDHAQAILAERGSDASRRRGNRSDFLLSGVIRCGHCGRAYIGMSARGNGGTYHYYACTARQKYGPKACQGERVPREKLETAVLRQLTGVYRDGALIRDALTTAQEQAQREQPALDERRHAITAEITRAGRATERYFEAFEQGRLSPERCEQRIAHLNTRLDDLRAQQAELANDSTDATAHAPTAADLATTASQLETVITNGEPEQTKALLRILIAELRVNSKTDIQPTYRIITPDRTHTAGVCATSGKMDSGGIELVGHIRAYALDLAARDLHVSGAKVGVEPWPGLAQLALILAEQRLGADESPVIRALRGQQSAQAFVARVRVAHKQLSRWSAALAARGACLLLQHFGLQARELAARRQRAEREQHPESSPVTPWREHRRQDYARVENYWSHRGGTLGAAVDYSPIAA